MAARVTVLLAVSMMVVAGVASAGSSPTNGGYPSLEKPTNGGYPSLHVPAPINGGYPALDVQDLSPMDPWPPGTLPPLDYSKTPFDARPPYVTGLGVTNRTIGLAGFDLNRAYRYLWHSYAAYCSAATLKTFTCGACKRAGTNVTVVEVIQALRSTLQGYVLYDGTHNEIIVSYRGSDNLENWLNNIKIWKADEPFLGLKNAKVAAGFYENHQALRGPIADAVNRARARFPSAPVFTTGHSLGGALAALSALDLLYTNGHPVKEVFTYGSPRVGNHNFALEYATRIPRTFRMANNRDIVPHLPPLAFDFIHYDQEIWQKGAQYTECKLPGEDPRCANSEIFPTSVYDHLHYMQEEQLC